jgi:lipoyl-dependent peroxiredoxin
MEVLYTAEATATGGRKNGRAYSSDGAIDVQINPPKEVGGSGEGTNPEQLFAAGYAACFANAMRSSARRDGAEDVVDGGSVTAHVDIGALGKGRFGLAVELEIELPGLPQQAAEDLVDRAHQRCPYSNATRGNIEVTLTVAGGDD